MPITKIYFKCYHEFNIDETELLYTRDDGQIATCHSAASMATELGVAQFSLIERIQFLWLDFCALIPFFRSAQFDALKIDIMPALLRKIAEMNQFLRDNYDCAGKNVDCLSDAKVVCLGETHTNIGHRKNNGKLIDELIGSSHSDLVLDERTILKDGKPDIPPEAMPANVVERRPQTAFITKPIATWGWDCRDQKYSDLITAVAGGLLISSILTVGSAYYFYNNNPIIGASLLIPTIYFIVPTYILQYLSKKELDDTFIPSNQHMCKVIENFLNYRKIYVIAGASHLCTNWAKASSVVQAVGELNAYLKNKKHMLLIPKK